ncbi:peptidoglycan DD-metalloendopeptidase family protein [Streptomyces sp. SID8382]|uniref:M23 family metallopeptidase n=1 Tax=Streptomyces malaysiensis TaxID=92644 RepID=UPI000C2C50DF|nr:M23 family metallopeptidase [Streptomyces sp. M56]AUA12305.1 Glycyl-glycine endopeptidase ALE-1 precursor [Streptomyces sp. M56]MYX54693.1 peptidoglycan DD-metalloendopeptidase family protein [Streptomyces sp. SID8382]
MASNRSVLDEAPYRTRGGGLGTATAYGPGFDAGGGMSSGDGRFAPDDFYADEGAAEGPGAGFDSETWEEWNPTEESIAPVRGRHRVAKQRGGTMARSGAVLGVGVIAAVGAGGMASAKDRPALPISMPDLGHVADQVKASLPAAKDLPGIGSWASDDGGGSQTAAAPLSQAGLTNEDEQRGTTDAGEALRARILQQAENQQNAADEDSRTAAAQAAAKAAADKAADQAAEAAAKRKAKAEAAAAKRAAEQRAKEAAEKKAAAERQARLAAAYTLPVGSYTLTASFGQAGDIWSADHTGQDFAAPTGTPVKAVHGGTITQAGWAGSYGYRIVLTLDDGTELWFCHLSSMVVTSGKVSTGDVIARVGATGNVTGPHLHLEVRPGGGSPIDPMPWLRQHGMNP